MGVPKKKKKKKKKKKANKEGEEGDDEDVDEVTAALRELGEEMPTPSAGFSTGGDGDGAGGGASISGSGGGGANGGKDAIMAVDLRRLKAEDELKSIFGARVIHAVEVEEGNRGG